MDLQTPKEWLLSKVNEFKYKYYEVDLVNGRIYGSNECYPFYPEWIGIDKSQVEQKWIISPQNQKTSRYLLEVKNDDVSIRNYEMRSGFVHGDICFNSRKLIDEYGNIVQLPPK